MTDTPIAIEMNCETGVVTERPLTLEEIARNKAEVAAFEETETQRQSEANRIAALKESAKTKLIAGKPLTEEEAAILVI